MDEARLRSQGQIVDAHEFAALPTAERDSLRDELVCSSCGADAYFIREARNGRRACFGSRPHGEDCELASLGAIDDGSAALDETDQRVNAGDVFRIDPNRPRRIKHVRHDPDAPPHGSGTAARYTRRGGRQVRQSGMSLDRLLRQLVQRPKFRQSDTLLVMNDDSRQTVRSGCVHMKQIQDKHFNRLRVYWGVIRFPRPREDGGAWLNTGRFGAPTVAVGPEILAALLEKLRMEELEDLSGSSLAIMGKLRRTKSGGRLLFADDVEWLAIRAVDDDLGLN